MQIKVWSTTDRLAPSPVKLFIVLIFSILAAATSITLLVRVVLPPQRMAIEAPVNGFLLVFVLFPCLYAWVLNPLLSEITRHKLTEKKLQESEQEWEDVFNTISASITLTDRDFTIIKANRAAQRLPGFTLPEAAGLKCYQLYHGADSPRANCVSRQVLSTGQEVTTEL